MRILTAEAMQAVDRAAIEELGIPGPVLMENAALGVVDALAERYPRVRRVAVLCGPGNNGGDGFAVARHLAVRGYDLELFLVRGSRPPAGDAALQLAICRRMGLAVQEVADDEGVPRAVTAAAAADLVVDALFGTGLGRALEGHFARLVEALGRLETPLLAVDLPSGLAGSSAHPPGPHLAADLTVTFAALKVAHVFEPAAAAVGEVVVADLGIPPDLVEDAPGDLHLTTAEELAAFLLPRRADAHKGTFGHLLLVAGSPGKSGAVVLAARAAVRGGAGLVTAAVPEPLLSVVDAGSLESMTLALPAGPEGRLGEASVEVALAAARGKDAAALGPGLGVQAETGPAIRRLVLELELPLALDADGLNAFAGRLAELTGRRAPTVLTPHPGELGRLLDCTAAEVQQDRPAAVRRAAEASGCVVLLKGRHTLVAAPQGGVHVNPTGNPGMATGGTGDVLTGLLGALLAQGYEALAAAQLAAYLHGAAGDLALADRGPQALAARDLVEAFGAAFRALSEPAAEA